MGWKETKEELKKTWILFLFFGIFFLLASAFVNSWVDNWMNERSQGPPCRIEFSKNSFPMTNSTYFNLQYLLVNLRDKDLLIEGIENWCYWKTDEETTQENKNIIIDQPISKEIPAPAEFDKLIASKTEVKTALNCMSPPELGNYKIKIVVKTTSGNCEGDILMEVKDEQI